MKGDFTRFTFQPEKHYRSVLMQQGRVQLDADWNEETQIQAHFVQSQAKDMIGVYGAATDEAGNGYEKRDSFKITPVSSDLAIAPGNIYVNGILCELESGTPFSATPKDNKLQVNTLIVDNRKLEVGQWLESLDPDSVKGKLLEIDKITDQQELLLKKKENQEIQPTKLRRAISYKTQPDFPQPSEIKEGWNLVYLDVWQRHITAIEDADIREVALNAPDTTTRIKTLWQVKLLPLDNINGRWEAEFNKITAKRNAYLTANDVKNGSSEQTGSYQRGENQLYRVEIHQPGKIGEATFKWSQDNGATVFAVSKIESNQIIVKNLGRDTSESFNVGQWVEIIDDIRELQGKPGTLVRLSAKTSGKRLVFDSATILGDEINSENFPKLSNPKVRRWDHVSPQAAVKTNSGWINLNNEIEVKFETDSDYRNGDYWLIPLRTVKVNGHNILWKYDGTGEPLAQPPQGIKHQYCPLALVYFDGEKFSEEETKFQDLRETFPPLSRAFDRNGGIITGELEVQSNVYITGKYNLNSQFIPGNVHIGTKTINSDLQVRGEPLARLHVQAAIPAPLIGNLSNEGTKITETETNLHIGDTVTVGDRTGIISSVNNQKTTFTLNSPFTNISPDAELTYQQPIMLLADSDNNPKVIVNSQGNVGIGTATPTQKLEVVGDVKIAGDRLRNAQSKAIIDTTDSNLLKVNPDSEYNAIALHKPVTIIDGGLTIGESSLSAEGNLIVTKNAFIATTNDGKVGVGTQNPTAKLEVVGNVKISDEVSIGGIPPENLEIPDNNKLYVDGNTYVKGEIYVSDVYILGSGFKNAENQGIVDTSNPDWLRVNPDKVYKAIALYKPLTINNGGIFISDSELTVDNLPQQEAGELQVTKSAFLATNAGNVNIGSQNHPAKLEVLGDVKIAGERLRNSQNKAIINTSTSNLLSLNPEGEYNAIALHKPVSIIDGGLTIGESSLSADGNLIVTKNAFLATTNDHNVGVGTQNPTAKLEVAGDVKITEKVSIGSTLPENLENQSDTNIKLYVDGDIYLTGKIYSQEDNTPETETQSAFFTTTEGNIGVGTSTPQAKLEVAGDIKIAGDRLRNAQNKAIIDTTDSNLLKVNPDSEYNAIALHKPVTIIDGGLTIGESSLSAEGNLIVNQSAFLATTNGNVNIGTQNHQANLKVTGQVNIGRTFPNNIPNTGNLKLSVEGDTYVSGNMSAQQYFQVSSQEMKENITELSIQDGLQILQSLNPVKFSYKNDRTKRLCAGFISEHTDDMFTTADKKMLNDTGIVAILTTVVKEYVENNSMLHQVIQEQQKEMSNLRERVRILEQQQKKQSLFPW